MSGTAAPTPSIAPALSKFRVHAGVVYTSGQVPIRDGVIVTDDLGEQVRVTLDNLRAVLAEAGSAPALVLRCNCFLRRAEDMAEFNRLYREFFGGLALPARTTVVTAFPNPRVLVEVEATAALPPPIASG